MKYSYYHLRDLCLSLCMYVAHISQEQFILLAFHLLKGRQVILIQYT